MKKNNKCEACNKPKDADGRCGCTNRDSEIGGGKVLGPDSIECPLCHEEIEHKAVGGDKFYMWSCLACPFVGFEYYSPNDLKLLDKGLDAGVLASKKYSGWSNYATWRVNLEMLNGWADYHREDDDFEQFGSVYALAEHLKDYCIEQLDSVTSDQQLAYSYALAFLDEVNWYEIAEHMVDDFSDLLEAKDK